jgi:hypothetical protein
MWTFKDREESAFLDDFDGQVIKAGFVEGFISGDKAKGGKPVTTQQLFLFWHPLDQEANDQPSWYGMGSKGFTFSNDIETITIGTKELELHEKVVDGPKLNTKSRLGILLDKLDELGFVLDGDSAKLLIGLKCHLKREPYGGTSIESERQTLMPTVILAEPGMSIPTTEETEDTDNIIISMVAGKSEGDLITVVKSDRAKALNLSAAKLFKTCDRLKAEGKLAYQNGIYSVPES